MKLRTFDVETHRITHGAQVPKLVNHAEKTPDTEAWIYTGDASVERLRWVMDCEDVVATHTMFESWVVARALDRCDAVLERIAAGMWIDTEVRELLCRIRSGRGSRGGTGVATLWKKYEGEDISASKKGPDVWRLNYDRLDGVPLAPGVWSGPRSAFFRPAPAHGRVGSVLVCGGRDFEVDDAARFWLARCRAILGFGTVMHGAAQGADSGAGAWAQDVGIVERRRPADWSKGRGAGFARNLAMLGELSAEDELFAVLAFPGGGGTAHTVANARRRGVRVFEYPHEPEHTIRTPRVTAYMWDIVDGVWTPRREIDRWPAEAIDYSLKDAERQERIGTRELGWWLDLVDRDRTTAGRHGLDFVVEGEDLGVVNERQQTAAACALMDMRNTGLWTDGDLAKKIREELTRHVDRLRPVLAQAGFLSPKTNSVWTSRMLARERAGQRRLPGHEEPFDLWTGAWKSEDGAVRRAVEAALGDRAPRTDPSETHPTGCVKKDRETVGLAVESLAAACDADGGGSAYALRLLVGLRALAAYNGCNYQIDHYLRPFEAAASEGRPMTYRFRVLVDSGRTSSSASWGSLWDPGEGVWMDVRDGTNVQNLPKTVSIMTLGERCGVKDAWSWAKAHSVRACIVAPPGKVLIERDYSQIELVCYAHVLRAFLYHDRPFEAWGPSSLSAIINAGVDPHSRLAAEFYAEPYALLRGKAKGIGYPKDPEYKKKRDQAKPVNFGVLGGMRPAKFQRFVRTQYGYVWSLDYTERWFEAHQRMVPDMAEVMETVQWMRRVGLPMVQLYSRRVRGGCTYTSALNTLFQGLAIDGAKRALFMATCAARLGRYPVDSLPERGAPTLDEYRARMDADPEYWSGRFVVDHETGEPTPCAQRWRRPTLVTQKWGRVTFWVEDDRLLRVGYEPCLFVHDSMMGYARGDAEAEPSPDLLAADACLDEIMCRGMQPVVPGILTQTEGGAAGGKHGVIGRRWG